MFFRRHTAILAGAGLLALAGCFNEPEPAYKTRPEGAEIRLQDRGISSLDVKLDPAIVVYVNLDRNEFREVPQEVLACTKLKWLRLNGNRLESLPDLGGLKDLRRIYLKNNKFAAVPEALKALDNLTDLELSGNPITEVPGWLTEMKSLKKKSQTEIPILIGMEFALHGCGMKDWAASTHTSVKHMTIAPTKPDHW